MREARRWARPRPLESYLECGKGRTRLSTRGQLVVPETIRERHGWTAGAQLTIEDAGDDVILRAADSGPGQVLPDSLLGCAGYSGPPRSLRDMAAVIAKGAARAAR